MFYEKKFSVDKPTRKRYRLSSFKGYDPESGSGTLPRATTATKYTISDSKTIRLQAVSDLKDLHTETPRERTRAYA